jgi:hypothetical protein
VEGWGGGRHALGVCDGRCSSEMDGEGAGRGNIHSVLRGSERINTMRSRWCVCVCVLLVCVFMCVCVCVCVVCVRVK